MLPAWLDPAATPPDLCYVEYGMSGKWLELLKEIAPRVTRAAVLRDPSHAARNWAAGCNSKRSAFSEDRNNPNGCSRRR